MAQITGIHSRDISRVIQELEKAHFFTVTHYVGRLNSYTLTLERPTTRGNKLVTGGRTAVEPVGELPPISISKKQNKQTADGRKLFLAAKKSLKKVEWSDSGFILSEQVIDSLTTAFPAVDITAEVAKAHSWCSLNPDKAPGRDYGGFLFRWMTKAQPSDNAGEIAFSSGYTPPDSSLIEAIELEFERDSRRANNE